MFVSQMFIKTKPLKPVTQVNRGPLTSECLMVPSDQSENRDEHFVV